MSKKYWIYGCFIFMSIVFKGQAVSPERVDIAIVGGGSAGLTAAIYAARAGFSTLLIEGPTPGGAITQSTKVYNWPGEQKIAGPVLVDRMRSQAKESGAKIVAEEVVQFDFSKNPFSITVQDIYDKGQKRQVIADACIIALGETPNMLYIPGEKEYFSRGVYTCAVCDGALYKDKVVAVIGGGDGALVQAEYLAGVAKKVYIINRAGHFKGIEKVREKRLHEYSHVETIYKAKVREILGNEEEVTGVVLELGENKEERIAVDAVFLAIGSTPNTQLLTKQIQLDDKGFVVVKKGTETSVPGVFAAGDVADPVFKQAIIASGEGAKAAMQATDYLRSLNKKMGFAISKEKTESIQATVKEISTFSELKKVLSESSGIVLIDFYANWCGPCRYLGKFTDGWAQDLQGKATLCKVNVDLAGELASLYRIRSMPTVIAVNPKGEEVERKVGVQEILQYIDFLKR